MVKNKQEPIWIGERNDNRNARGRPGGKVFYFGFKKVQEKEKAQKVHHHFDTVAEKYDLMNTLLSFGIHLLWKRSSIMMLKLKQGDRVLDVCGGTGDLAIQAAMGIGDRGQVVIYDINRAMLEKGRPKVEDSPYVQKISYAQGDAEKISFPDQSFDVAMVGFGIRNLTHMEEGFREMYRVLKPGGKLMCLEFSQPTAPLFCRLYDLYSLKIMPVLGWLIAGSRDAYTYLPESIRTFPLPDELSSILKEIGFSKVIYRNLTNGIAVTHLARKGF